jgi:hypothetical protein
MLTLWTKFHDEGHWVIQFFKITHTILITVYSQHQTMWPSLPDINQIWEKPGCAVCSCLTYIYVNTVTNINMRISGSEINGCELYFVIICNWFSQFIFPIDGSIHCGIPPHTLLFIKQLRGQYHYIKSPCWLQSAASFICIQCHNLLHCQPP